MAIKGTWPSLALVLAITAAGASSARSESLADAMVMAVRTSPELAASRSNVNVLSERAVQARARGRVTVQGVIDLTAQFFDLEEWVFPTDVRLNVTQPLYTGGQVENATEAAELRITAEEARRLATEQSVLLDTVAAYSDVRRDQTLVRLSRNNVRVIREQRRAAEERFEVGEVTRTDVAQAEARLAAARSTLATVLGRLEVSREAYKRVVGEYPGDLDPLPPLPDLPNSIDEAVAMGMTNQPLVRAARYERAAAGSDVRAAIGRLLPQVSLLGTARRSDVLRRSGDSLSDMSVGLQITLPFYTGGLNYSLVREAQAAVEGREADIGAILRDVAQNVGIAWSDLDVARATIRSSQLGVQAAAIAFDGVQEEAKVGARTTLDVLDAEQELLNARGDLVSARRNEYVASYQLLFAIGKLTVDHLGLQLGEDNQSEDYYAAVKDRDFGYDDSDDTVWTLSYRP